MARSVSYSITVRLEVASRGRAADVTCAAVAVRDAATQQPE